MSTIDPELVRQRRRQARADGPLSVVVGSLLLVVMVAAAAATGIGSVALIDTGRITALNSVFAGWTSTMEGPAYMASFAAGLTVLLLSVGALRALPHHPLGSRPWVGASAMAFLGFAAAATWALRRMTVPLQVGVRKDPAFGKDEPWGWWQWTLYRMPEWGPWVLWTVAALSVLLPLVGRLQAHRRQTRLEAITRLGRHTSGSVTSSSATLEADSDVLVHRLTVRFTDHLGTERWVEKLVIQRRAELTSTGDEVAVVFDPDDPGNQKRIFVGPAGSRSSEQFARWSRL